VFRFSVIPNRAGAREEGLLYILNGEYFILYKIVNIPFFKIYSE